MVPWAIMLLKVRKDGQWQGRVLGCVQTCWEPFLTSREDWPLQGGLQELHPPLLGHMLINPSRLRGSSKQCESSMELVKVYLYPLPPTHVWVFCFLLLCLQQCWFLSRLFGDLFQILLPWLTLSIIYKESLANFMKMGYLFYAFEYLAFSGIMLGQRLNQAFGEWVNLTMASPWKD